MYDDEEYQREQYELEQERQRQEEQARESEWQDHYDYCFYIAEQWLMGYCSFDEAEEYIRATGDNDGVLSWAQYIIDHTKLTDED
jgi:hypothetical protein